MQECLDLYQNQLDSMSLFSNFICFLTGIMVKFDIKLSTKIVFAILLSNIMMVLQIGAFALIFFILTKEGKTFIILYIEVRWYETKRT